jgi:drug/metabolite transporter (DMT)-like permease
MSEALALLSALCFGLNHFVNGVVSRRWNGVTVAAAAQAAGTVLSLVIVASFRGGQAAPADLFWGTVSGIGTGVGVAYLYRAMSRGPMSVVAPVSDVAGVALPVLVGVLLLGERPSAVAFAGIAVALVAIWLVSRGRPDGDAASNGGRSVRPAARRKRLVSGVPDALVAGVGIAAHFIAVARIPADAGLWPLTLSRAVSVVVIGALMVALGAPAKLSWRASAAAALAGAVGTLATILYWVAVSDGLLTTTAVLAALYPAIPVVLAIVLMHERLARGQVVGLLGAGVAIALISA